MYLEVDDSGLLECDNVLLGMQFLMLKITVKGRGLLLGLPTFEDESL
jgi:hypothetical protein